MEMTYHESLYIQKDDILLWFAYYSLLPFEPVWELQFSQANGTRRCYGKQCWYFDHLYNLKAGNTNTSKSLYS